MINKEKILGYLAHPFFISLIIWIIIIVLIPGVFSKYRIVDLRKEYSPSKTSTIFCDLDNDGNSERLDFDTNDSLKTKVTCFKNGKTVNQYDLRFHPVNLEAITSGDYDDDGFKECYVFTVNNDSIFLNIIDPLKKNKIILSDRYIDKRLHVPNSTEGPNVLSVNLIDLDKNQQKDLVFIILTGYLRQPRNVYRYIISSDSLIKSPQSGAAITNYHLFYANNDSFPEMSLNISAYANLGDSFPFTDRYSWLMVLDKNLKFVFPPEKLTKRLTISQVLPLNLEKKTALVLFNNYCSSDSGLSYLSTYDLAGIKLREKVINNFDHSCSGIFENENNNSKTFYFLKNQNTEVDEIDSTFAVVKSYLIPEISSPDPRTIIDADRDGRKEIFFRGSDFKSLVIVRNDFSNPLIYKCNEQVFAYPIISPFLKEGNKPALYLQFQNYGEYVRYEKNPLFNLKYPFYFSLYLLVFLFVSLIERLQRYRMNLKAQTENEIANLQMRAIKNQIDPHFTFNMLNVIGGLYATEPDRSRADYIFGKYVKMIRETVISSDKIIVTLGEEIDFIRTFLDLELFRYDNSFSYSINLGNEINPLLKIPRMLIYTFVENSVKYGLRNKHKKGKLKISVTKDSNVHIIQVEDNGPGFNSDSKIIKGTGKGLSILDELIELYYKLEKIRITYSLKNVEIGSKSKTGTIAVINIPS